MVAKTKQRQTEYNDTYTQITVKHYKRYKKLIFYWNLLAIYLITGTWLLLNIYLKTDDVCVQYHAKCLIVPYSGTQ